jgi:hypothetical protein
VKNLNPFTPWEEHYFWVNILLDHAIFVRDYLSPVEVNLVKEAEGFIGKFKGVKDRLDQIPKKPSKLTIISRIFKAIGTSFL